MILVGDCLGVMRGMDADSVDAIVTDPPYGLGFMGKAWDHAVPGVPFWLEMLRVAKPGAFLVAFGGTRTSHRMACAIEDAGWELRDTLMWVYGSGFPKSLDVSKAIDASLLCGKSNSKGIRQAIAERPGEARTTATLPNNGIASGDRRGGQTNDNAATNEARQWQGWGTALKPAWEPIILARKPVVGTVAANVLAYGTGALNIDGCRIETSEHLGGGAYAANGNRAVSPSLSPTGMNRPGATAGEFVQPTGRWPANLIHDGSEEVLSCFPNSDGSGPARVLTRNAGHRDGDWGMNAAVGDAASLRDAGTGSAARFFYCAKANKRDRGEGNNHPTVKPTDLMRWLCRLVTPPGGLVLDPFAGSGSTGRGAILEGLRFTGIELDPDYARIAEARIAAAVRRRADELERARLAQIQAPLFAEAP